MLTFELDSSKTSIEIYLDEQGIDDLIRYLKFVKNNQDHYNLLVGNELDEKLVNENNTLVKRVTISVID
jgi:hypothetical protein